MNNRLAECTELSNGVKMPWLGLGVWKVEDGHMVENAVRSAIQTGYRSIDTAAVYGNEQGVGRAVAEAGVPREELFITTKVWNSDQGYETTLQAFEESRRKLGLDYVDLYLIHWPVKGKYKDTWKALEKLYKEGSVRAIGVSNFHPHHLDDLLTDAEIVPMVNQVETHPLLSQKELLRYCKDKGIQMEAWSPLMQGNLDHPVLQEIAQAHGKSPAQVILRWDLQNGVIVIPKSTNEQRIKENSGIFDFELSASDMEKIDSMNENKRFGADPDNFNF
ncbi:aldo/keto reductase [Paenibacillus sp. J2TS4]|uniref:aldo/keto reductase n=1 Tax=Paenibacillus sp. J2TS4 TaxID=2807194 RepID=UPI001B202E0A|nr:aldo/keto reductase [Paenibacillus sp. J2TS4]GIP35738.1 putative oxidoreductase YtbE [Paenibacillus sp. J2TS4]